jgi:amino-acid N-acetyltransferase
MSHSQASQPNPLPLKPSDLRGILEYIPLFRGHIFVIAIDGSIVAGSHFGHILTDIAVLRSLNIRVLLVHGIGHQMETLAAASGAKLTDTLGEGPTDAATLATAQRASAEVALQFLSGMSRNRLMGATLNAARALRRGILGGVDQQFSGRLEQVDKATIEGLLKQDIVPVFSPIQFDKSGQPLRLNSDELAARLAIEFQATKLIFLCPHRGLTINGQPAINIPLTELETKLDSGSLQLEPRLLSKARQSMRALNHGTDRAHILDGRVFSALLTEIFDKVGIGTMIHADAYQLVRKAEAGDISAIHNILSAAARTEAVRSMERSQLEQNIDQYYVYQVDGGIIACCALRPLSTGDSIELCSVLVLPYYQGRQLGRLMVSFAIQEARRLGYRQLVALTTQARAFFEDTCGFTEGTLDMLPESRRVEARENGRNSLIFVKQL